MSTYLVGAEKFQSCTEIHGSGGNETTIYTCPPGVYVKIYFMGTIGKFYLTTLNLSSYDNIELQQEMILYPGYKIMSKYQGVGDSDWKYSAIIRTYSLS